MGYAIHCHAIEPVVSVFWPANQSQFLSNVHGSRYLAVRIRKFNKVNKLAIPNQESIDFRTIIGGLASKANYLSSNATMLHTQFRQHVLRKNRIFRNKNITHVVGSQRIDRFFIYPR